MELPSTLLLTVLGGHFAALPSNTLLSPKRTDGLTFVPAGVSLEQSINLARSVECVILGRDDFVGCSFGLGQDLALNNYIVTEISRGIRGLA
ncbi:hypothetical protein DL768_006333 [Monosporascus sp. mg162]|nr:hypothetical protein DL768_006333 [Monosporascus sp. mg162]